MAMGLRSLVVAGLVIGFGVGIHVLRNEPADPDPEIRSTAEQVASDPGPVKPDVTAAGAEEGPQVSESGAERALEARVRAGIGAGAPSVANLDRGRASGPAQADLDVRRAGLGDEPGAGSASGTASDEAAEVAAADLPGDPATTGPAGGKSSLQGTSGQAEVGRQPEPAAQVSAAVQGSSDAKVALERPVPARSARTSGPTSDEQAVPAAAAPPGAERKPEGSLLDRLSVASIEDALRKLFGRADGQDEAAPAASEGPAGQPSPATGAPGAAPESGQSAGQEVAVAAGEDGTEPPVTGPRTSLSEPTIKQALAAMTAGAREKLPEPAAGRDGGDELPTFDIVRVTRDGTAVIAGRARPGAEVEVRAGEKVIDRVTADRRGNWASSPLTPLEQGEHEITLAAYEGERAAATSDQVVVVAVPGAREAAHDAVVEGEPPPPQPADVADRRSPSEPLAVLLPRQGMGGGRVLQAPGRISKDGSLALIVVDYDDQGQVRLAGEAPAGSPLRIYVDNEPAGEAVADRRGRWSAVLNDQLGPGTYTLRLDQLDSGGRPVTRLETPFSRVSRPPQEGDVRVDYVIVQPGNSLWRIARRLFGRGTSYVHIYENNRGQIRDPDLIYPGQVFEVPLQPTAG